jgi:hypothetical protein
VFHTHHKLSGRNRLRHLAVAAGGLTVAGALIGGLAGPAGAAARATTVRHVPEASAVQPSITSVSFKGTEGSGQASPTITITGTSFGANPPTGTSDNSTTCGGYTANGDVYGHNLYFTDNKNFEAGYSNPGATCVGIIVQSWSSTKVVLQFGDAYGTFAHWYLTNGDGYAISIKTGIWGSKVSGLTSAA